MKGVVVPLSAARAGDVVLFSKPTSWRAFRADPKGTFLCALIHLSTRSRYNHAALVTGNGFISEATDAGIVVSRLADKPAVEAVVIRPLGISDEDRDEMLAYAKSRVGERYGYLTAFMCGLENVLAGHVVVRIDNELICSEYVARALERAGADFGKSAALVAPGDLATFFGLLR